LLFTTQVVKLLDIPTINGESSTSMKNIINTINECLNILRGMKILPNEAESFLARIIVRKLGKESMKSY
jgi:hypothetical protein